MTVGEGIFWSTVLVLVFASVVLLTKHKRWRTFWKVVVVILVLGAFFGVGVWLY